MTFWKWSKTAASNSNADSTINWAEGQAPSSVNDSARALMAAAAKYRDDVSGMIDSAGTSTAYTATSNQNLTALTDGFTITLRMNVTSGLNPFLSVDALTTKEIRAYGTTDIPTGALAAGGIYSFTYDSGLDCWFVHNFYTITTSISEINLIGGTQLTTPAVDDSLLTYDLSATANRRILTSDFLKVINALTEDGSPDSANDFLLSYDTSASAVKKIKPQNIATLLGLTGVSVQVFGASGTWTRPSGCKYIFVISTGAGGGGADAAQDDSSGGGGAGATCFHLIDVSATPSIGVTIGAAGAGGTSNGNGTAGGSTTFGPHTAGGGSPSLFVDGQSQGGAGGTGSGGSLNINGGRGFWGVPGNGQGGNGGSSFWGSGGSGVGNGSGESATVYGAGGGGGGSSSSTSGGNGAAGVCFVLEFKV